MTWFIADVGTGNKREFFNTDSIGNVSWSTRPYRDEEVEGSVAVETVFVELTFIGAGHRTLRMGEYTTDQQVEFALAKVLGSTATLQIP